MWVRRVARQRLSCLEQLMIACQRGLSFQFIMSTREHVHQDESLDVVHMGGLDMFDVRGRCEGDFRLPVSCNCNQLIR